MHRVTGSKAKFYFLSNCEIGGNVMKEIRNV